MRYDHVTDDRESILSSVVERQSTEGISCYERPSLRYCEIVKKELEELSRCVRIGKWDLILKMLHGKRRHLQAGSLSWDDDIASFTIWVELQCLMLCFLGFGSRNGNNQAMNAVAFVDVLRLIEGC